MARTPAPEAPADNVIALSRFRAQLGRGRRNRRIEELFDQADPERAIRALPPDEFFYVCSEAGFPDALEILPYATSAQVQAALDFSVWNRDELSLERADEWLGAMVEAPYETVGRWVRGLDIELVALLIRKRARIHDLSRDEEPDDYDGIPFYTPDRLFVLDLLGEGDQPRITARLLDSMCRYDSNFVCRLLVGAGAEVDAELEEMAYRWRSGRMADLGFVDFHEALEAYRELDPASVEVTDRAASRARPLIDAPDESWLRVSTALAERLSSGGPFARAVGGLTDPDQVTELQFALVAMSNRVLAADRVAPEDHATVAAVLTRMASTLDLAVEFLARGSEERAVAAVRSVPVARIFQVGVSLVGKVRRLGRALQRETPFAAATPGVRLHEPLDAEVLAAVTRLRPMFPRVLETPPAAGERPFAAVADLGTASAALERAGAAVSLLYGLGLRPEHLTPEGLGRLGVKDPAVLDTAILARTLLVPRLLGGPPAPPRALPLAMTAAFAKRFEGVEHDRTRHLDFLRAMEAILVAGAAAPQGRLGPAEAAVAARWATTLLPLEPVLTEAGPFAPGFPRS